MVQKSAPVAATRKTYTKVSNKRVLGMMAHTPEVWQGGMSATCMGNTGNENATFRTFEIAADHLKALGR